MPRLLRAADLASQPSRDGCGARVDASLLGSSTRTEPWTRAWDRIDELDRLAKLGTDERSDMNGRMDVDLRQPGPQTMLFNGRADGRDVEMRQRDLDMAKLFNGRDGMGRDMDRERDRDVAKLSNSRDLGHSEMKPGHEAPGIKKLYEVAGESSPWEEPADDAWGDCCLLVRNLPNRAKLDQLLRHIGELGLEQACQSVQLPVDQRTGVNRGYAFVYGPQQLAHDFLEKIEGTQIRGFQSRKRISATWAAGKRLVSKNSEIWSRAPVTC